MLASAFAFPQPEFHRAALSGRLRKELAEAMQGLPYRVSPGASRNWRPVGDYAAFQSEYIRLFEVGSPGNACCSLYEGHHGRDRMRTMEALVRFYHYFGLRSTPGLMPDHATAELEFMHHLTRQEAHARQRGGDTESYLRAQRDFLERHLNGWWPLALDAARRHQPHPFYRSLMTLVLRYLAAERRHLASALSGS